ncbi:electron transfer flavoprotein alpha subunit, partial [Paragonimus westermani]
MPLPSHSVNRVALSALYSRVDRRKHASVDPSPTILSNLALGPLPTLISGDHSACPTTDIANHGNIAPVLLRPALDAKSPEIFSPCLFILQLTNDFGIRDTFYSDLATLLRSTHGSDLVVLAGDMNAQNGIAEKLTPLVLAAQSKVTASYLVVGCSTFGRDLLPRVAAKLHVSPINDVIAIHGGDTFQRPIYAGNAMVTLKSL